MSNEKDSEKKLLKDYIKEVGSFEEAGRKVGINGRTLRRILNGEHKPSRLLVLRLQSMGIEVF